MYDILIKNGTIIDGSGKEKFKADIALKKGKIKKIGKINTNRAKKVIDANNLYVSPGFVDINNHSDSHWTLFTMPGAESMLSQGITTIITGNCGSSLAPLVSGNIIDSIQKWTNVNSLSIDWLSVKEFLDVLEKRGVATNFGTLVGHATLRRGLIGDEFRKLTPQEMKTMEQLLKEALKDGAFGLSTGLVYSHAKVAPTEEITKLAKITEKEDCIYTTHVRGEAEELIPAIEEVLSLAQKTKASVQISHLKAMGQKNWPNFSLALGKIETASSKGLDINFDIYPYTATGSILYILLPDWAAEGGKQVMLKRLKDKRTKQRIIAEMQKSQAYEYDKVRIAISPADKSLTGKSITELAQTQGISTEEAIINLLIASEGRVITFFETLSEDNIRLGLKHPLSLISSDGSGYNTSYYKNQNELIHPRCFGTFPKVLGKYVREEKILTWEDAIAKMTNGPARKIGLKKRGLLKKGNFADITIFNPQTIIDKATFENPFRYSEGVEHVIINGQVVLFEKKFVQIRAGKVLRK